jgi:protein-disulfide isomerase
MEEKILDENKDAVSEAQAKTNNRVQPVSKDDNLIGSADAKVKIIVYSDFECPFCATLSDSLQKVRKNFNGRASIAFRHFPLLSHSNALPAALAAECAGEQSKFWEMHDRLFADNISKNLNLDQYKKGAKELKLDIVKFSQCLETEKYKTKIEEQMLGGRNSGVTGAPTVFVNNEIYPGAMPYEDFTTSDGQTAEGLKSIIERLLK